MLEKNPNYVKKGFKDSLIKYISGETVGEAELPAIKNFMEKNVKATAKNPNLLRRYFIDVSPAFEEIRKKMRSESGSFSEVLRRQLTNPNLSDAAKAKIEKQVTALDRFKYNVKSFKKEFPDLFKKTSIKNVFKGEEGLNQLEELHAEHKATRGIKSSNVLPESYIMRAEAVPGTFNQLKLKNFDVKLINLANKYKNNPSERTAIKKQILDLYKDFNKKSGGYLNKLSIDFNAKKGNVILKDTTPIIENIDDGTSATRQKNYDDFKKTTIKNLEHAQTYLKNTGNEKYMFDEKKLKKLITSLCPNKASGGRVGMALAGSAGLECGKKQLQKHLIKGTGTQVERGTIAKIVQGGSNLMKGLSPKEMLKIRNLIGPAALAFEAGIGAGVITYDTLVKGTPIKQALGNNWLTSWAMPKSGTEYMHKDMNLSSPGAKTWAKGLDLGSEYDRLTKQLALLEGDPSAHQGLLDPKIEIPKVKKRMNEIETEFNKVTRDGAAMQEGTGAHEEYMKELTEYEAKMMTRDKIADDVGLKPQKSYSRYGPRGMGIKDETANIPIDQKRFSLPESKLNLLTQDQILNYAKEQNLDVTPQQADEFIVEDKWRQLFEQPGIRGAQDWRGATGGRVSFKFGSKGVDVGRRKFLQLLAALGIGTAGAKSGISLFGKAVGKKAAVTAGADIVAGTPGMPSWFPALVNKVIKEGDDVTSKLATKEREIVHTKKLGDPNDVYGDEVTVYRDLDTGDIRVESYSGSNMGEAPIQMEYKAPSVIDEGKMKGKKTDSEFSAVETEPRVTNWDGDIEFDGDNIVGNVDDLMSDTTKVKNYAEGKKPTLKDIVTSKKKRDAVKNFHDDQVAQMDYIENKQGHLAPEDLLDAEDAAYHKSKEGLASGGRVNYDTSLPDIDDID